MAGCGAQAAVNEYAPAAAELCFVGKRGGAKSARQEEINELLVHHCLQVTALCLNGFAMCTQRLRTKPRVTVAATGCWAPSAFDLHLVAMTWHP